MDELTPAQRQALEKAIACLDAVRTGSDFEVECHNAATKLAFQFEIELEGGDIKT